MLRLTAANELKRLRRLKPDDQVRLLKQVDSAVLLSAAGAMNVGVPVALLRAAGHALEGWAEGNKSRELFPEEVEDIVRRVVAEDVST